MKKDNEKGFALVLSLVLLLVMSLMGGSLIVISAGDHRNNNISDTYQQTFYVAETALLEGEKYIINQYLGPRTPPSATRELTKRNKPINEYNPGTLDGENYTDCYNSFPGLPGVEDNEKETDEKKEDEEKEDVDTDFKVAIHSINIDPLTNKYDANAARIFNFGTLLADVFTQKHDSIFRDIEYEDKDKDDLVNKEKAYLDKFEYEYFITKLGPAPFRGFGTSIKKGSSELGLDGIAYRIYGCGTYTKSPEIIIPLESTIVLPG